MRRFVLTASACLSLGAAPGALGQGANVLLNCTSCHTVGPDGAERQAMRRATDPYPDLNGQSARYLERQLEAYRLGLRQHKQMQATATALGDGAAAMARMYADAPTPDLVYGGMDSEFSEARTLIAEGDWSRGLPACSSCHALDKKDRARQAPRLHGQPQAYTALQLRAYADGTRQSGPMGRMRSFAAQLTDEEISDLAAYYAAWRPAPSEDTATTEDFFNE